MATVAIWHVEIVSTHWPVRALKCNLRLYWQALVILGISMNLNWKAYWYTLKGKRKFTHDAYHSNMPCSFFFSFQHSEIFINFAHFSWEACYICKLWFWSIQLPKSFICQSICNIKLDWYRYYVIKLIWSMCTKVVSALKMISIEKNYGGDVLNKFDLFLVFPLP